MHDYIYCSKKLNKLLCVIIPFYRSGNSFGDVKPYGILTKFLATTRYVCVRYVYVYVYWIYKC